MLGVIERRITELVSSFLAMPDDERLDDVCAAVLHATIRQATVSSEGGKRLRALLAVDTFDALASDDYNTWYTALTEAVTVTEHNFDYITTDLVLSAS